MPLPFGRGGGFRETRGGPLRFLVRSSAIPLRWAGRTLLWAVRKPFALVRALRGASGERRTKDLLRGLPALLATLAVALIGGAAALNRANLPSTLRRAIADAEAAGETELALTLSDRLERLEGGSADTAFDRGQILARAGRDEEAAAAMQNLARRRPPEPRAHVWLAERLLTGPGVTLDETLAPVPPDPDEPDGDAAEGDEPYRPEPPQVIAAVQHLRAALATGLGEAPRVHRRLAEILLANRMFAEAVPHLEAAAEEEPPLLMDLGRVWDALGRGAKADAAYRRAAAHYTEVVRADPADREARLKLVAAEFGAGRRAAGEDALRRGLSAAPDPRLRALLAEVLVADAAGLPNDRVAAKLAKLREALSLAPNSQRALMALAGLAAEGDDDADRLLDDLLAAGTAPDVVHLAAGLRAGGRGDEAAARFHFERALCLNPGLAIAANNLAYLLARPPDGATPGRDDLERALEIMNRLIDGAPQVATFRDTRGMILLALDRPADALDDLERALQGGMNGNAGLHERLAETYDRLGQPGPAAAHRRRAATAEGADAEGDDAEGDDAGS